MDESTDIERQIRRAAEQGADFIQAFYAHISKLDIEHFIPRLTKAQLTSWSM